MLRTCEVQFPVSGSNLQARSTDTSVCAPPCSTDTSVCAPPCVACSTDRSVCATYPSYDHGGAAATHRRGTAGAGECRGPFLEVQGRRGPAHKGRPDLPRLQRRELLVRPHRLRGARGPLIGSRG